MKNMYILRLGIALLLVALMSGLGLIGCGEGEAGIHDIAILNATCSLTNVTAGDNTTMTFDIENLGTEAELVDISIYYIARAWGDAGIIGIPPGWPPWPYPWPPPWPIPWPDPLPFPIPPWPDPLPFPVPYSISPGETETLEIPWCTTGLCTGDYIIVLNVTSVDPAVIDEDLDDNIILASQVEITNEEQPYEIDSLVELLRYFQTEGVAPDPMVIYEIYVDDEDGWEYRDDFAAAIVAGNYTGHFNILEEVALAPDATDLVPELLDVQGSGADVLCGFVYPSLSELFVVQAADMGLDSMVDAMVVALGANSEEFWTNTVGEAEGIIGFGAGGDTPYCRYPVGQWQSGKFEVIAPPEEATASPIYPMDSGPSEEEPLPDFTMHDHTLIMETILRNVNEIEPYLTTPTTPTVEQLFNAALQVPAIASNSNLNHAFSTVLEWLPEVDGWLAHVPSETEQAIDDIMEDLDMLGWNSTQAVIDRLQELLDSGLDSGVWEEYEYLPEAVEAGMQMLEDGKETIYSPSWPPYLESPLDCIGGGNQTLACESFDWGEMGAADLVSLLPGCIGYVLESTEAYCLLSQYTVEPLIAAWLVAAGISAATGSAINAAMQLWG